MHTSHLPTHPKGFEPIRDWGPESIRWYLLIKDMEEFRRVTGYGLAQTWSYVNRGELDNAEEDFRRLLRDYGPIGPVMA